MLGHGMHVTTRCLLQEIARSRAVADVRLALTAHQEGQTHGRSHDRSLPSKTEQNPIELSRKQSAKIGRELKRKRAGDDANQALFFGEDTWWGWGRTRFGAPSIIRCAVERASERAHFSRGWLRLQAAFPPWPRLESSTSSAASCVRSRRSYSYHG